MVFATPGMLHAGLSLQIFKKWADDEKNMVYTHAHIQHMYLTHCICKCIKMHMWFISEICDG